MGHYGDLPRTVPREIAAAFFDGMVGEDVTCIQDEAVVHACRGIVVA